MNRTGTEQRIGAVSSSTAVQAVARNQLCLPLPPSPLPRVFAGPLGVPARPPVVASPADGKQYHAARYRHANQQGSRHPIENVVDHGMTGVTWIEINTYGLRRPVTRGIERI
jgi:hypothetical protein